MKAPSKLFVLTTILICLVTALHADDKRAGFYMPDSLKETTLTYRSVSNLIIISVTINETTHANLIMDTGCRNLLLFGRKFKSRFVLDKSHKIKFSGLGSGRPVEGDLSLGNSISFGSITGENMPVVIIPDRNIFSEMKDVDGVIGYDLFLRFEIELNPLKHKLTFRPAHATQIPEGYAHIPARVEDSKIIITSSMLINDAVQTCDLMIDTGSSLGLLLKTTDLKRYNLVARNSTLGLGLNGTIEGFETVVNRLDLQGFQLENINCSITKSPWHNYASIGMDILKDYSVLINYCKGYICLKRLS